MRSDLADEGEWVVVNQHAAPELLEIGAGRRGPFDVLELVAPWDESGLRSPLTGVRSSVYPAPDQQEVWPSFDSDSERPDPVPSRGMVGAPITATFFAPAWVDNGNHYGVYLDRNNCWLEDEEGEEVAIRLLEPSTDEGSRYGIAAIPLEPLQPATEYTVQLAAEVAGEPWQRSWSFVTAP